MTTDAPAADVPEPRRYPVPVPEAARGVIGRWWEREKAKSRPLTMLVAGVLAPPVLFHLDRGSLSMSSDGVVPFRPYPTLMMAVSVAVFLTWLAARRIEGWGHAVLAGPLLAGGLFALAIGLVLLPLSLIGILFAGVGLLGFIPFWTAVAYFRAAALAYGTARRRLASGPLFAIALLATLVVGLGVVGTGRVARLIAFRQTAVLLGERDGDPERAEFILRVLWAFPQVPLTRLREAATRDLAPSPDGGPIAQAYRRITGHSADVYLD